MGFNSGFKGLNCDVRMFMQRNEDSYTKLTPRSKVLEKLTDSQLVKKLPAFYGTRRSITAFTSAGHLFLP